MASTLISSPPIYGDTDNTLLLKIASALTSQNIKTTSTSSFEITGNSSIAVAVGEVLQLQNVGTAIIYVGYGNTPTASSCNVILRAGTAVGDGVSPPFTISNFVGTIYIVFAGTGTKRCLNQILSA